MQPTEVQVQASLKALARAGDDPLPGDGAPSRRTRGAVPDGLLEVLADTPALREERLVAARRRLDSGVVPSGEDLAGRMVGRIVCDRLR